MTEQSTDDRVLTPDDADAPERRVQIAKDVLERLAAKQFVAACGIYVGDTFLARAWAAADFCAHVPLQPIVQKLLNEDGTPCHVCALGGAFLAAVDCYNRAECRDMGDLHPRNSRKVLSMHFTYEQLQMIEVAFEVDEALGRRLHQSVRESSYAFGDQWDYAGERLQAIMQNIVDNDGTFKP